MNRGVIATVMFCLQILLILTGGRYFGKFINPILLLMISSAIPFLFILLSCRGYRFATFTHAQGRVNNWLWATGGLASVLISLPLFISGLQHFNDPIQISDVIPQVQTLARRFYGGEYPYTPIDFGTYQLEPIYMPMQWLPVGLSELLKIDVRWPGFICLALSSMLYGYHLADKEGFLLSKIISLVLPAILFNAFLLQRNADLLVSYEIITGAYYLVLGTGLLNQKVKLVGLGILLCLLSRYTLFFWLPLLAIIYFLEQGIKQSLRFWLLILAGVIVFYLFPFFLKDPTLLERGHSYYTGATIADWNGYGDPPVSWTQENGISFAATMKKMLGGEMAHKVSVTRNIQFSLLGILFMALLLSYRHLRKHMDMYSFALMALYLFLMVFYFFAPLTYRYYLFSFMIISAVLCSHIILMQKTRNEKNVESI